MHQFGVELLVDESAIAEILGGAELPGGADSILLAIGTNRRRAELGRRLGKWLSPPAIHPSAVVSPSARLGDGTVVLPGVVINAGAVIGEGVILNSRAIVEHGCFVGDYAHVSPGAVLCGEVTIGAETWIGAGAVVIQQMNIGRRSIVGAGAVVIREVAPDSTVVGNPARALATCIAGVEETSARRRA
jgi:sugar O-acyltransferase (sialic acid O-acetyltransferase NeuD family)